MDILCSAGKGLLSKAACLECALNAPPCGFDYTLLKSLYGDDEQDKRREEIHVTDLTGCIRKAWYDKQDPSPQYPHEMLTRWMGTAVHGAVEASDDIVTCELPLAHDGIVGRADIVYDNGRVVDIKTTRWLMPAKLPYGSHVLQVNIYAWMLRKMGKPTSALQIQYIDMSGPSKCRACSMPVRMLEEGVLGCPKCGAYPKNAHLGALLIDVPIYSNEVVERDILRRKGSLEDALNLGLAPEKEPGFLCNYCPHMDRCRPEEP